MDSSVPAPLDARGLFTRAARLLSESRSHVETLEKTLEACLPALGDFGFFDAREAGDRVVRVARAHDDPALQAMLAATRWERQDRDDMNLCALTTGLPALHPDTDDAWYRRVARDEAQLAGFRALGFRSMMTVPMRCAGELIGSLTIFMSRSGRRHDEEHFAVAQDLAGLAAPVVANARLLEERAEAESALRRSQERLHMSVKAAGLGPWEWNERDNSVYWSREYRNIYGIPDDEAPSHEGGMSRVHPQDRPFVEEAFRVAYERRVEFQNVHRITHPTRGLRWIEGIGRVVSEEGGVRMTGVVRDITERHESRERMSELRERLEDELRAMRRLQVLGSRLIRREDRLEDLLEEILRTTLEVTARDRGAILLVDPGEETLRFAALIGFGPAFPNRDRRIDRDDPVPSARAWRTGQRVVVEDLTKDAEIAGRPVQAAMLADGVRAAQSTPLVSRDGRVIGVLGTHSTVPRGVDEREARLLDLLARSAADYIERAQYEAMLTDADRRKDEFLAILSHELRNPLAPIRYAAEILRATPADAARRGEAGAMIERQVKHLARLLDDLLDVSRIARGAVALKREPTRLEAIVGSAVEASRPAIDSRRHALHLAVRDPGLVVDVDPVRLVQIVTNLLNNAARYMDPGGRIDLVAGAHGRDLEIRVKDRGIGIAPELRPRLFRLFARAEAAMRHAEGGLGIGLALVHGFVTLHGGTVIAESDGPGSGAEFVVRIPGAVSGTPTPALPQGATSP